MTQGAPARRDESADRTAIVWLAGSIAVGVVIRLLVFRGSGFPSDVGTFMAWAKRMADLGPQHFYAPGYFSDYPPGFLYVLAVIGKLFDGEVLRLVVKGLSIPADIALAILLFVVVRRYAGAATGALAGALWMLQPGPIFAGPFWGQVDSWGTLPFMLALLLAGAGRWGTAGVLAGVSGMIKPQFGLVAIVLVAAAAIEWIRSGRAEPLVRTLIGGAAAAFAIMLPFWVGADHPMDPLRFVQLVQDASGTYPYTSLFAFNVWSIVGDFWKPDDQYVVVGGIFLVAGIAGSVVPLWWRRDTAALLACGACAAMSFYFLPTRAHERYLFPAFALLLPFAVMRARLLWPYVVLALAFFVSLYYAFTAYPQNGLPRAAVADALLQRPGQIVLAALMLGAAAYIVWLLFFRGEARLEATAPAPGTSRLAALPRAEGSAIPALPPALAFGHAPTRRDLIIAVAVALLVLGTRGFRLDQPRDMYFDEVYHARTAYELLAQREPYEWTHPHLAKEIMALGITAFGGDGVEGTEPAPANVTAFAVSSDGARIYGTADGTVVVRDRGGRDRGTFSVGGAVRAVAVDGAWIYALGDRDLIKTSLAQPGGDRVQLSGVAPVRSLAVGGDIVALASDAAVSLQGATTGTIRTAAVAVTARPDGSALYVLDGSGTVHAVDPRQPQQDTKTYPAERGAAIAYAQGPDRIFVALADRPALEVISLENGSSEVVPLANGRTGDVAPATALAVVTRAQFVYALARDRLIVIEPHGASPYTSIPVHGTQLGVDGTGDQLLIAGGGGSAEIVPTGRHALAWRIPGVIAASILAFFVVLLARRLFASEKVAILAGAAVVLDGSMFAQARIGMNDIYVGLFLVAGWYFVVASHAPRRSASLDLLIAGVLFGLAAASKWAAFYALAGLGLMSVAITAWAWSRGRPGTGGPFDLLAPRGRIRVPGASAAYLLLCFAVIPVAIYLGSYYQWFGGPTIPFGWNLVELTQQMYWYHSGLTAPHPAGSPWWSWPLVLKPVYWYLGNPGPGQTAVIYDAGNVVLFWGALGALVWAAVTAVRTRSAALGVLVFALLSQYVAWIPITRVLFFYHFFTALPFYLLILAAALVALWESGRRTLVTAYVALAAAAFVFFYPFISGMPVPADQAAVYFVLPTWQYDCQFYPAFRCDAGIRGEIPFAGILSRVGVAAAVALVAFAGLALLQNGSGARLRALVARSLPRGPAAS